MSISSKSSALRLLLALVLSPVALATSGYEAAPQGSTAAAVEQTAAAVVSVSDAEVGTELVSRLENSPEEMRARVPFCGPGEKVVCTLGPPPVCSCQ